MLMNFNKAWQNMGKWSWSLPVAIAYIIFFPFFLLATVLGISIIKKMEVPRHYLALFTSNATLYTLWRLALWGETRCSKLKETIILHLCHLNVQHLTFEDLRTSLLHHIIHIQHGGCLKLYQLSQFPCGEGNIINWLLEWTEQGHQHQHTLDISHSHLKHELQFQNQMTTIPHPPCFRHDH